MDNVIDFPNSVTKEEVVLVTKWKQERFGNISAETAANQITELYEQSEGGVVTAKMLLDANRGEDAPLHDLFEWDDSIAAEQHRLSQARYILRQIVFTPLPESPTKGQRFIVNFRSNQDQPEINGYVPTTIVINDPSMRSKHILDLLLRIRASINTYRAFSELSGIVQEYDAIMAKLAA